MKTSKYLRSLKFSDLILHEDDDFIIINKPPFLSTLEDRSESQNVLEMARTYQSDAQACHRLDKNTSGLLVLSKNNEAYKYFSGLLAKREVHKLYHALVHGRHELDEEIHAPIYTTSNRSRVDVQGKESTTFVKNIHLYSHHTLLACMPLTGRMHQIRVHLSYIQLPICGDDMYGGEPIYLSSVKRNYKLGKFEEERPMMERMALHSQGLSFENAQGKNIKVQAPYPKDLEVTLKQLAKNS